MTTAAPQPPETRIRISLRRKCAFGLALSLLVVGLFLALLEGGLRLVGYGYSSSFYRVEEDGLGKRWYRENPWCVTSYFSKELTRRPQPFRLPVEKGENAYRIFVLGSSAAMGDPEASFSLSRVLEAMLRAAYPDVEFEVVNAALTAINSHVARQIAEDCAQLQPDLFIVYEGNNEVIGPFGPASVFAPFVRSEFGIGLASALRQSRTGQMVGNLGAAVLGQRGASDKWGGMEMFLEHRIRADDPRLETVAQLFEANLRAVARAGEAAGAETLLCTVLTNQLEFAPFQSLNRETLDAPALESWSSFVARGDEALGEGDAARAESHYQKAWEIDAGHAALAYRLGRCSLSLGRQVDARKYLQKALDLDALRFRVDSRLNASIRKVGRSLAARQGKLVDLEALALEENQGMPLGGRWLYEHVHLSFFGTYRVASALFDEVSACLVRDGRIAAPAAERLGAAEARDVLGFTIYEQALIMEALLDRFSKPPFTAQMDREQRLAQWEARRQQADALLGREDARLAVTAIYEAALARRPDDWVLARNFGMYLVATQRPREALVRLAQALAVIDDDLDTLFALGSAHQALGESEESDRVFDKLRKLEPRYPGLPRP